jgi:hypothetical protein
MAKAKDRPTTGTDGRPLPTAAGARSTRLGALVRDALYAGLPGCHDQGWRRRTGVTVELLMLASASAVVGGLFIGSESRARCQPFIPVGAWSANRLEFLAAVAADREARPVPRAGHQRAVASDADVVVSVEPELLPLMAIVPS